MHTSEVFIGGQWRPPSSGETYATATEEVSAQVAKGDERDIDLAIQASRRAFASYPGRLRLLRSGPREAYVRRPDGDDD